MHISEQGLALIRRFEGFSAKPYLDAGGKMTIGYGHLVQAGEAFPASGITKPRAETLLKTDAAVAGAAVERYITQTLTQCQFDALCSFVFNVGAAAFARSTLKSVVNKGWHGEVPAQMARWVYAGGKKLPGLKARREAEGKLYLSDM